MANSLLRAAPYLASGTAALLLSGCMAVGTAINVATPVAPEKLCAARVNVKMDGHSSTWNDGGDSPRGTFEVRGGFLESPLRGSLNPNTSADFQKSVKAAQLAGASYRDAVLSAGPRTVDSYAGYDSLQTKSPCTSFSPLVLYVRTSAGKWGGAVPLRELPSKPTWGTFSVQIRDAQVEVLLAETTDEKEFRGPAPGRWAWKTLPQRVVAKTTLEKVR